MFHFGQPSFHILQLWSKSYPQKTPKGLDCSYLWSIKGTKHPACLYLQCDIFPVSSLFHPPRVWNAMCLFSQAANKTVLFLLYLHHVVWWRTELLFQTEWRTEMWERGLVHENSGLSSSSHPDSAFFEVTGQWRMSVYEDSKWQLGTQGQL